MLQTLSERAKTVRELVEVGRFYFERPGSYEDKARVKLFTLEGAARLGVLIERLATVEPFEAAAIEGFYRELTAAMGLKLVDLAQLTRLAVTGRTASPPLFDVLALLGRDEMLARLRAARTRSGPPRESPARPPRRVGVERRATLPGPDRHPALAARPGPGRGAGPRAARLSRARGLREPVPPSGGDGRDRPARLGRVADRPARPARALARAVGRLHGRGRARSGR